MVDVTYGTGRPQPALTRTGRRWLVIGTAAWGVLLLLLAFYSWHSSAPTVRDQSTVADAKPAADRAVAEAVRAAGDGAAATAVTGYQQSDTCKLTPVRRGVEYHRTAVFYTAAGREGELLRRIAAGLPGSYQVSLGEDLRMRADAGSYVSLSGGVASEGEVRVVADTGCQAPADVPPDPGQPTGGPQTDVPAQLARVGADRLVPAVAGLTGTRIVVNALRCPDGTGLIRTVEVTGDGDLPSAPEGALLTEADRYAYRSGGQQFAARRTDDRGVVLTATTADC